MLEKKRAVIFDLDGTLMDSMWMWRDIDREYLGRFDIPLPEGLQQEIEGMGFTETACYFKETFRLPETIEQIKADWNRMAYEKYATRVPLKQGARRLLTELKSGGVKLGIATSNDRILVEAALKRNRAEGMFDCIRTSCEVGRGKPAPDIYLSVARTLGIAPEECLVFEDIPNGILAGKNAGMAVCAIEDAYCADRRTEVLALADYYIRSFDDVLDHTYEVLR